MAELAQSSKLQKVDFSDAKITCLIGESKLYASQVIAEYICQKILAAEKEGRQFVLGLATGSTPIPIYNALVNLYNEKKISFENVITVNLDEYWPLEPEDKNSYHLFMNENFFKFVNFQSQNNHIPSGTVTESNIESHCSEYEAIIRKNGIDLQILGIGRSGHIGFNEPGSQKDSVTRLVQLHKQTISDAAPAFNGEENVPKQAITMGIGSIFEAKECILCAWGANKAKIVREALTVSPTDQLPASFLQLHKNAIFVIDKEAAPL